MTVARLLPLPVHAAIEMLLGLAAMASAFSLGLPGGATVLFFAAGAVLVGVALSAADPGGISVSVHRALDQGLAAVLLLCSLALAGVQRPAAVMFLALAVAQILLLITTRYSARR